METNSNEVILKSLFYNKVTTPTEKIRMIKDEFKISLKSLGGEDLSKAGISYIINGINGVTEHSGPILIKNINSLLRTNVTLEWLMEKPSDQANRLLETNIESYKKGQISIGTFEKIVNDNTSYAKTNLLLEAYENLAEAYRDLKHLNHNKALTYCEKGIEIAFKISNFEKEINFKRLRGNIELEQGDVIDALRIYKNIKERTRNKELRFKIHYNIIICLRKLERFEEMLTEMEALEKTYEISVEDIRNLKLIRANSFSKLKKYEDALQIYEELLNTSLENKDTEDACILCYNIADIHEEKGDLELAKKYISLRLEQENDIYMVKHLLFAATVYNDLAYVQKAKKYIVEGEFNSLSSIYNREIKLCMKNNDIEMLRNALDSCIELGIKIEQPDLYLFMLDNFEKEEYRKYLESFKENKCF